jgi:hypothetical protein
MLPLWVGNKFATGDGFFLLAFIQHCFKGVQSCALEAGQPFSDGENAHES